jgi:hypothetical protein
VLNGYLAGLKYLKPALAAILVFVGTKMLIIDIYKIPALASLAVIVGILGIAVVASLLAGRKAVEHIGHIAVDAPAGTPGAPVLSAQHEPEGRAASAEG